MEILREAPHISSFVPLIEHQSTTPASFYAGPPVLHYYSDRSKLIVLEHEATSLPALAPLLQSVESVDSTETNGDSESRGKEKVIEDIDVWVTSDKLFLYSNTASSGLSIPYPSISLHAIQSLPQPSASDQQGLYMQVITSSTDDPSDEDTEPESISLTIIPTASAPPQVASPSETLDPAVQAEDQPEQTPVVAMFNALSNCSNLHPDLVDQGDEDEEGIGGSRLFQAGLAFPGSTDGGLPPAMPGSGGWITAENMHEFIDEDGNWIGDKEGDEEGEGLGPGAGTVRTRDENGNGDAAEDEDDETKWRRTS